MKTYEFQFKHDGGSTVIRTTGTDVNSAKRKVLEAEKAPESAIGWWRVVPTQKQINKTKNLLRNI